MAGVYETTMKRRSIRRFKNKKIPIKILKRLVDAARVAPSGANLQPLEYIIVQNNAMVDNMFPLVKWAGYITPAGNPPEGMRPAAYIVVVYSKAKAAMGADHDSGASVENMILTALEKGIGSCWMGAISRSKIAQLLKIPDSMAIDTLLALGYPAENPKMVRMKDSVKYWKDAKGRLHVPKRALKDVLHLNRYQ